MMGTSLRFWIVALGATFLGVQVKGAEWSSSSPPDGDTVYACVHHTATFTWNYLLSAGDSVGDVQWFFDGRSQEMVAFSSHSHFFSTPTFAHRVEALGNAGLTLRNVAVSDTGNYSVEVHVYSNSGHIHTLLRRSLRLVVSDQLMTTDGVLHVTQRSGAVLDPDSVLLTIQLQCGTFTFLHDPPYQVEWRTPSGNVYNSSNYSNGHFNLLLPRPIEGGNYSCSVPASQVAQVACAGDSSREASVLVDRTDVMLMLLEKENERLRQRLALAARTPDSTLSHHLQQTNADLAATKARLAKLEDAARHQVAFHAADIYTSPGQGMPIVFNNVYTNLGNAYGNTTGYFTAPHAGLYFFIATAAADEDHTFENHSLWVDWVIVSAAFTHGVGHHGEQEPCVFGTVHLKPGQRVWVQAEYYNGTHTYLEGHSTFSGFLISRDL